MRVCVCACVREGGVATGPKVQLKMPEVRVCVRAGGVATGPKVQLKMPEVCVCVCAGGAALNERITRLADKGGVR